MTVELSGVAATQARISDIQAQLATLSGARPPVDPAAARVGSFESALRKAANDPTTQPDGRVGATGTADGTDGPTLPGALTGRGASGVGVEGLITAARKYLGVPYKWGGTNPATGLDCSAFVQRAFADIGVRLPRIAADQARQGRAVTSLAEAKPGDLVAFGSPVDHIGIYLGNNQMIVAPRSGDVVKIQQLYRKPSAIRRILPEAPTGASTWPTLGVGQGPNGSAGAPSAGSAFAAAPQTYRALFQQAERSYGVKAELLAAVAKAESGFNSGAVSRAGAIGLMQLMPATARGLGVNPRIPSQAVDGAARLLRDGLRTFGSVELALAAYNAGPGAVRRHRGIPPYSETQAYVRRIMADPGVRAA